MNFQVLSEQSFDCLISFIKYIIPCIIALLLIHFLLKVPSYVFRKCLHLVAFTCVTVMIVCAESWQAAVIASVIIIIVIYPVLSLLERQAWFAPLFVQKSRGEIKRSLVMLFGMFAVLTAVSWGLFGNVCACAAAILMWGTGDAAAALVGIPYGNHKIKLKITDGKKSLEGTAAMFIVSTAAGFATLYFYGKYPPGRSFVCALVGGILGALTELISPSEYDTVTVPSVILAVELIILHIF